MKGLFTNEEMKALNLNVEQEENFDAPLVIGRAKSGGVVLLAAIGFLSMAASY